MPKNPYAIIADLRNYEYKLLNASSVQDIDILLLEVKSYISNEDNLKNKYLEKIEQSYKLYESKKYQKDVKTIYKTFKAINRKVAKRKKVKIFYPIRAHYPYYPDENCVYSRSLENKQSFISSCYDFKDKCMYLSVLMPYMKYENFKQNYIDSEFFAKIKAKSSLSEFYAQFDNEYRHIKFPKDIEFYLSTINTYNPQSSNLLDFITLFTGTCMCYVLRALQMEQDALSLFNNNDKKPITVAELPDALQDLTDQEKKVYEAFYTRPYESVQFVADEIIHCSSTRVNNIINKICGKLKIEDGVKSLKKYINDLKNNAIK